MTSVKRFNYVGPPLDFCVNLRTFDGQHGAVSEYMAERRSMIVLDIFQASSLILSSSMVQICIYYVHVRVPFIDMI